VIRPFHENCLMGQMLPVQFISQKFSHLCVAQTAWIESRRQWTLLVLIDFDKYTVNAFLTGWVRDKNEAFSKTSWLRVQSKFVPTAAACIPGSIRAAFHRFLCSPL